MDQKALQELYSIKAELLRIINELEDIERGLRNDFSNIGTEKAADCISKVIKNYRTVKRKLDNIDTEKVTEAFAKTHGLSSGGGSGGGGSGGGGGGF